MARRNPTLGVFVFYSVVVTAALLLVLVRTPEGSGFTAVHAKRDAVRLAALVGHTRVEVPGGDGPVHVTWSPVAGGYRGLVLLHPGRRNADDAGSEVHLVVRLAIDASALLRNPARLPLPSATLARDPPASDLVQPDDGRRLLLTLDPAADGGGGPAVSVDNVLGPSGSAVATAVGRGWNELVRAGEPSFDPWDLRVLAVLTRSLRAKVCDDPAASAGCRATALTVGRSHRPRTYGITLTELSEARGELRFELQVTADGPRLRSGSLRPLRGATLTSPAELLVTPPRDGQRAFSPGDPGLAVARYRPGDPAWAAERWTVDFRTLLEGTAW